MFKNLLAAWVVYLLYSPDITKGISQYNVYKLQYCKGKQDDK